MKACLFLSACLLFVGCGRQEEAQREVLGKLEALKTELASKQSEPVRWAFASKREIESAISQWSSKQAETKRVEGCLRTSKKKSSVRSLAVGVDPQTV